VLPGANVTQGRHLFIARCTDIALLSGNDLARLSAGRVPTQLHHNAKYIDRPDLFARSKVSDRLTAPCGDIDESADVDRFGRDRYTYNHPSLWWFFNKVKRLWLASLKRRSQTARLSWERFIQFVARFFPPIRTIHPLPCHRFDARTRGRSPVR
jgi:hypothetical protein